MVSRVEGWIVSPRKSRRKSACFSRTRTSIPARARRYPSIIPAGPPPAMQQRLCNFSGNGEPASIVGSPYATSAQTKHSVSLKASNKTSALGQQKVLTILEQNYVRDNASPEASLTHKVPVKLWASRANVGGDRTPTGSCWETLKAGCCCLERITSKPEVANSMARRSYNEPTG